MMHHTLYRRFCLAVWVTAAMGSHLACGETALNALGFRAGVDASEPENMEQYEIYATWRLPWWLSVSQQWQLGFLVNTSGGILTGQGRSGFVGAAGPAFSLGSAHFPLSINAGSAFTLISEERFDRLDLGGPLQFTSHLGFAFRLVEEVELTYRFHHISNAGLFSPNPGLNMHLFGIRRRF